MRRIGVGVIGVGIQGEAHVICFKELANAKLVAVSDINEKRGRYIAQKYGAKFYRDYHEMLRDPEVDIVSVATPDYAHKEPVIAAAEAGKHIIVEKPMATSINDAEDMVRAVKKAGVKFMVNFENRFNPAYVRVKDIIKQGLIGRPLHIYARLSDTIYVPTRMLGWSAKTTVAFFLMSHTADLARWYFEDEAYMVYAIAHKDVLAGIGINTPDLYVAIVNFRRGGTANLESCWILPESMPSVFDFKLEVIGSEGAVFVDTQKEGVEEYTKQEGRYAHFIKLYEIHGTYAGFLKEALAHFVRCVLEDREPIVKPEDGLANVKILVAVDRSAREGRPITIS